MENSAFEAIRIGTNVVIFMVAVAAAFTLMGAINDMVEFTGNEISAPSSGTLVEEFGKTATRTFTGAELLSYYGQKKLNQLNETTSFYVVAGGRYDIATFVNDYITEYLDTIFELKYEDENTWVFITE